MTSLDNYGWNFFHQQNYTAQSNKELAPGRVVSIKGFKYYLITGKGELETELSGKLLYGTEPEDLPKVGDWVCYLDYGLEGYITDVLPRINALSRKNPGNRTEKQILATNIDYAFVVQGLDRDFNTMRLERYIVQVKACGITPMVILNKADLPNNLDPYREEISKLQRDCKVFFCSALTGFGLDELYRALEKYRTYIFIGSSGAGKSSLLNLLMDVDIRQTGSVSDVTGKGKHTTTSRDLFRLPNESLLIDTPGMREFGVTFEEGETPESLFPVIRALGAGCRYADCRHISEPGCAVISALQSERLSPELYESFMKLIKEQKRFQVRIEDKKRQEKQFGKMTREARDHRKKHKF